MTMKVYNGSQLVCSHSNVKHLTTSTSLCGSRKLILTFNDNTQTIVHIKAWEIYGIWQD